MSKNIFSAMRVKKKRLTDPNAQPRPTLLGHEKEMKIWREQFINISKHSQAQSENVMFLKRKVNRLQARVDALESIIKRLK